MSNYLESVLLFRAVTRDGGGNEPAESLCPQRELWIRGDAGVAQTVPEITVTTDTTLAPGAQRIRINTTSNAVRVTLAPMADWPGEIVQLIWEAGSNTAKWETHAGDTVGGITEYTFTQLHEAVDVTAEL